MICSSDLIILLLTLDNVVSLSYNRLRGHILKSFFFLKLISNNCISWEHAVKNKQKQKAISMKLQEPVESQYHLTVTDFVCPVAIMAFVVEKK